MDPTTGTPFPTAMEFLVGNSLTLALGLLSLLLSVVLYLRTVERPSLAYVIRTDQLLGGNRPELPANIKILAGAVEIKELYRTRVAVWNCGRTTLTGDLLVDHDRPRMQVHDTVVVGGPKITTDMREASRYRVAHETGDIVVGFDYSEPGEGFVFEFFHAGNTARVLSGSVRGSPQGLRNMRISNQYKRVWYHRGHELVATTALWIAIVGIAASFAPDGAEAAIWLLPVGAGFGLVALVRWMFVPRTPTTLQEAVPSLFDW